jgi:hypothetical protein
MSIKSVIPNMRATRHAEPLTLTPDPITGRLIDSHPGVRTRPMQVLVLGASRTGTMSILTALEKLGYNPYHMAKAMKAPKLSFSLWVEALRAKFYPETLKPAVKKTPWGVEEFDKVLGDFDGVSDVPSICFAEELIAAYPDAKVVLNTRDVDAWLRSMDSTAGRVLRWRGWATLAKWDPALVGPWWEHGQLVCPTVFGTVSDYSQHGPARAAFHAHYARVRAAVEGQEERLLEYRVQDGWGPLCEFLGREVPEGEFPRVNDSKEFVRVHGFMWWLGVGRMVWGVVVMGAPALAVGAAFWWREELRGLAGRLLA